MAFSANLGFLWADLPLLDRVRAAKAAGFDAIELHFPYGTPAAEFAALCQELDLKVLGLNTDIQPGDGGHFGLAAHPGRKEECRELITQAVEYAVRIGAPKVHVMAGGLINDIETAIDTMVDNLRWATKTHADKGVTFLVEPLNPFDTPDYAIVELDKAVTIIDQLNHPNVKLMFDAYHIQRTGLDPARALGEVFGKVGHIQIAGVPSREEPVDSELDLEAFFGAVKSLGYDGKIGLEYKPTAAIADQLKKVEAIWNAV